MTKRSLIPLTFGALLAFGCASTHHASQQAAGAPTQPDYQAMYDELIKNGVRQPSHFGEDLTYCPTLKRRLALGEECIRADQIAHYQDLARRMQAVQMKMPMDPANQVDKSVAGGLRRPLHAKAHACVKAYLEPVRGLGAPYASGLFADGKTRPAWVRFSNAKGIVENDNEHDARGMAVKVMDVHGTRLGGRETQTQDFLMTNKPRGTARTSEDFVRFAEASAEGKRETLEYFAQGRLDQMVALLKVSNKKIDSMVKETYWSGGPFLWGDTPKNAPHARAAKFKMQPCTDTKGALPDFLARDVRPENPSASYLKDDLKSLLASHDVCMVMSVQMQKDPVKQPIEDGFQEWSETDAPLQAVAYLKIPKQTFDSDAQYDFCERMTFSPWNGLTAHRPLGDLNRARRYVYGAVQSARLEALPTSSAASSSEPQPDDAAWNLNPL